MIYLDLGNKVMAERLLKEALEMYDLLQDDQPYGAIATQLNYGKVLMIQGRYADAERIYKKAGQQMLGPKHPDNLLIMNRLITTVAGNRLKEAISMAEQLLIVEQEVLGADHSTTRAAAIELGRLYSDIGRFEEAETLFRSVIGHAKRNLDTQNKAVEPLFEVTVGLMWNLVSQCRWVEVEAETMELLTCAIESGSKKIQKACCLLLWTSLPPQRKFGEMMPFFEIWMKSCQGNELQSVQLRKAMSLIELGKYAEAEALLKDLTPQVSALDKLLTVQL